MVSLPEPPSIINVFEEAPECVLSEDHLDCFKCLTRADAQIARTRLGKGVGKDVVSDPGGASLRAT